MPNYTLCSTAKHNGVVISAILRRMRPGGPFRLHSPNEIEDKQSVFLGRSRPCLRLACCRCLLIFKMSFGL